MVRFNVLSIFPELFSSPLGASLLGKAIERRLIQVNVHDIRDYAADRHTVVDDVPYGGGSGMVMKPEPLVAAIEAVTKSGVSAKRILLTPQGQPFNYKKAEELAGLDQIVLVCGRYEGVDERVVEGWIDEEISIGDYVLTGGEIPALVIIDSVSRFVPGVVGDSDSVVNDTFSNGHLKYPQYTRPREFKGRKVPEVLLTGNHEAINKWREDESRRRTAARRPDLLKPLPFSTQSDRGNH